METNPGEPTIQLFKKRIHGRCFSASTCSFERTAHHFVCPTILAFSGGRDEGAQRPTRPSDCSGRLDGHDQRG